VGFRFEGPGPNVDVSEERSMSVSHPVHREVHFWSEVLTAPPCGTLEDRFEWSDAIEDVTCEECREALAGDGGELGRPVDDLDAAEPPSP
jgi:hypothetical protein